jgi:uncharacterized cupin superfamily protein
MTRSKILITLALLIIVGGAAWLTWDSLIGADRETVPRMSAFRGDSAAGPKLVSVGVAVLPSIEVPPKSAAIAQSHDKKLTAGLWESPVGDYEFKFNFDEVVYIVDGEVIVHTHHGSQLLRAGDSGFFPRGLHMRWEIKKPIRKVWVHRHHERSFLAQWGERATRFLR